MKTKKLTKHNLALSALLICLGCFTLLGGIALPANAQTETDRQPLADENYRWLYERLFAVEIREQFPAESFKSFRVHLKDSDTRFPEPEILADADLTATGPVRGTMTYAGIVKKKYAYEVRTSDRGQLIFEVRVHLKNPQNSDHPDFDQKLAAASEIWNAARWIPFDRPDFDYRFEFRRVDSAREAHFSVSVLDSTRGPYDQFWGRDWTERVVAHEVGHMMGLGDEYQTVSGVFDCYRPSLMCTAWTGAPLLHQYYFILRRLLPRN